jgi:predicted site-specific integrase-resolvase
MSLSSAAQRLSIGRTLAYQLAARGEFPCRVLRVGRRLYRVPIAEMERLLGEREAAEVGAER